MNLEQDWKPVVLKKSTKPITKQFAPNHQKNVKLEAGDVEALPRVGIETGKQIQKSRVEKKLSQEDLAKKLNVRPVVIRDYENGSALLDKQFLSKIRGILGMSK